jgi:ATP-dependent protease ClpP protease subunit
MKSRWSLRLEAQAGGLVEIALYDVIGEGVTAADVLAQLQNQKPQEIRLLINSAGGSVTEGMAIYSLLTEQRRAGVKVTARIDGLCASIATLIALAADTVEMAEGAYFMIHEPSGGSGSGTSKDLRATADLLDRMREQMLALYAAKTGKPVEELAAMCAAETWFTAAEAKAIGFVQTVLPSQALAASWDLTTFRKVPKGLGAINMTEEECKAMQAENAALKAKLAELEAKMAKAMADAPAKEDDGEEDPEKDAPEKDEPDAKAVASVVAVAKAITKCEDIEALPGALMALEFKAKGARNVKAQHIERVTKAIADGKVTPAQKAWALSTTPKAFDAYLAGIGDAVIAPIGIEHQPGDETAARARAGVDPSSVTLDATEKKFALSAGIPEEALLADKRARLTGKAA